MDSKAQKTHLRKTHLAARKALPPEEKQRLDRAVFTRFTALSQYKAAKTLLCYVSSAIEVDTRAILQHALQAGKTVAVPRCIPGTTEMEFHMITSLSVLSPGAYGILEPPQDTPLCTALSDALCVVPALCFDKHGYRVGYGKGYYDRFLARFSGETLGLIYEEDFVAAVPRDAFDRRVSCLVTPQRTLRTEPTP